MCRLAIGVLGQSCRFSDGGSSDERDEEPEEAGSSDSKTSEPVETVTKAPEPNTVLARELQFGGPLLIAVHALVES